MRITSKKAKPDGTADNDAPEVRRGEERGGEGRGGGFDPRFKDVQQLFDRMGGHPRAVLVAERELAEAGVPPHGASDALYTRSTHGHAHKRILALDAVAFDAVLQAVLPLIASL